MTYVIFSLSLLATFLMTRMEPMRDWARSLKTRTGASLILLVVFTLPFLGDAQGVTGELAAGELGIPSGIRLIRFFVLVLLLLVVSLRIVRQMTVFRHAGTAAKFMLLYAVIGMLSATYSVNPLFSLWKGFEVFVIVLAGISIAAQLKQWEDLRWLNNILMLIMLFFVLSALLGIILAPDKAFVKSEFSSSSVAIISGIAPMVNPNTLTQFSALLVVMALAYVLNAEKPRGKAGIWIVIALATIVMLLAHSRTSIFAGVMALAGVLYFGRRKGLAILLVTVGAMSYAFTEVVQEYILRGQTTEVFTSLTGRTFLWENVWKLSLESPIFGYGFYVAPRMFYGVTGVDNTYLAVMLGNGLVGLFVFITPVVIVGMQLLLSIPTKARTKAEKMLWLQLMTLFLLLVVRSFTGPSFQEMHPDLVMYMMLLIGVQAYRRMLKRPSEVSAAKDSVSMSAPRPSASGKRVLQRKARYL